MATVGPTNVPAFFNTDADFRTWGSTISAALATLGLVQTADTGQINWTTVSKPAGTNTAQGYEIWRFADSQQGTTPIFLKIEYGSGSAIDRPSIWTSIGSASNGSGTLTGQLSTRVQTAAAASKSAAVTLPFYASGNSGELILAINVDTATNTFGFLVSVERPKDSTDTTTSEGVLATFNMNGTWTCQYVPGTGSVPATSVTLCSMAPAMWARSAAGANADATPVFIPLGGVWRYSHLLITAAGDFAAAGTMTTTIFGSSHTYMALDKTCSNAATVSGIISGLAIRWE